MVRCREAEDRLRVMRFMVSICRWHPVARIPEAVQTSKEGVLKEVYSKEGALMKE